MTTQLTVLGLNQTGASIGLALAGHKEKLLRVGNDRDLNTARQAERMGAFDKVVINLHQAVADADVVILALPAGEIEPTLREVVTSLKAGVVVVDTSPVKVAVMESALALLGSEHHFVSLTPSLNPAYLDERAGGIEAAHADLFKDSAMLITSPSGAHAGAVQLATDLAMLMGGTPYFADPYEADGVAAAHHALPTLVSAALVQTVTGQQGWREGRRLAGKVFASSTAAVEMLDGEKNLGAPLLMNRANLLRLLDELIAALQQLRGMLDRQEGDSLGEYLLQARTNRAAWLKQRAKNTWDAAAEQPQRITSGEILGRLVGLRRRDKNP